MHSLLISFECKFVLFLSKASYVSQYAEWHRPIFMYKEECSRLDLEIPPVRRLEGRPKILFLL